MKSFKDTARSFQGHLDQLKRMVLWSVAMWMSLSYSSSQLFDPPSRRLANWNYFNWMTAYNLTLLAGFLFVDLFVVSLAQSQKRNKSREHLGAQIPFLEHRVPVYFRAITYNSLFYFLVANVLTGLVNFTFRTLEADAFTAMAILSLYLITLQAISLILYHLNVRVKV